MRRQCRRFEFQRILLPVRMRIHWGMGRFWAIFFASVRFVRKVLCDGCGGARRERFARGVAFSRGACVQRSTWRWPVRRSAVGAARRDDRRRFLASVGPRSAVIGCGARKSGEFVQLQLCVLR